MVKPVYYTSTGVDIGQNKDDVVIKTTGNAIAVDFVNWPAALRFSRIQQLHWADISFSFSICKARYE